MRNRHLSLVVLIVLFSLASSTQAVQVMVSDHTIDTPLGRFGYADVYSTMALYSGTQQPMPERCLYLGPLGQFYINQIGRTHIIIGGLIALVFGFGIFIWCAPRFGKRKRVNAT